MNSPESENPRRFTREVDWSPETPGLEDFSARTLEALDSMGFQTIFLNEKYLHEMLADDAIQRMQIKFLGQDFDFANLRTRKSQVAILPSLFLPGSISESIEEENIKLQDYEDDLWWMYGLEDVSVCRGNLADYTAIIAWLAQHGRFPRGLPHYIRTATTDRLSGGNTDIAIKYQEIMEVGANEAPNPIYCIEPVSKLDPKKELRLGPILIPGNLSKQSLSSRT